MRDLHFVLIHCVVYFCRTELIFGINHTSVYLLVFLITVLNCPDLIYSVWLFNIILTLQFLWKDRTHVPNTRVTTNDERLNVEWEKKLKNSNCSFSIFQILYWGLGLLVVSLHDENTKFWIWNFLYFHNCFPPPSKSSRFSLLCRRTHQCHKWRKIEVQQALWGQRSKRTFAYIHHERSHHTTTHHT